MYQNMTTPLNKRKEKAHVVMEDFVRLYTVNYPSEESPRANTARAIASEKQYEINKNAARTVAETLIPALSRFIDGMRKVAQFFRIIENELRSFEDEEGMDELKQSHYKAIPSEDSDQNYVEKWLKKTLADIGSQTTVRVLLGSSSGVEEMEPVDTGRKSNRAKTSKNNREPTPEDDSVQSKPVLPPKEIKPVPPPKNRRPSPPVNDPVPTLKDKPELPARNRSVSAPQEYETITAKDKPAIPPREEPELAPANDGVPNSKKKPVPLPRNGPASTPVHDQVPKSKNEHRARSVVISQKPTRKKKQAPSPPRNGQAPTTSVYHVPSSENKQAPSRKSKSAATSSDYAVPAPRKGQAQTTSAFYVPSPENKQAPSRKSKLAATSPDYAVPATRNKKESKNAQGAKPVEYQKLTTKETFV
ncbi:serine/arginine repetitive matrix protein 1-like [Dendronephthya gigantea]|uniref:serine/arginine repetitive matrix protein 1-like n=1 Tax=Dendronephthya gigantea TaxID=151771 RepID=UPI00106D712E|nr:serine/arginine repetitive matrix protein 1-like [Dendronephthya gigantea]